MKSRLKKGFACVVAVLLAVTMFEQSGVHAEDMSVMGDSATIRLRGDLIIENRGFKNDEEMAVAVVDETGAVVASDNVNANKSDFCIDLTLAKGKTYNYKIKNTEPVNKSAIKGVRHVTYDLQIKVDEDGNGAVAVYNKSTKTYIPAVMNGNEADLNKTSGGTKFFRLPYSISYEFWIRNKVKIEGRDWIKGEVYSFTVEYQLGNGNSITKEHNITTTELGQSKQALLPYTGDVVVPKAGYVIMKFNIRQGKTQPKSLLKDDVVNEVYVKLKDKGDGSAEVLYSTDGGKVYYYAKEDDAGRVRVLAKDTYTLTYFTGKAQLTTLLNGNSYQGTHEASYELYSYDDGDASMENSKKVLVGSYETKNGMLDVDKLEEGNYFFIQTKAPEGYQENKELYAFAITKENYKTMASIVVNNTIIPIPPVEPDKKPETEVKPEKEPVKDINSIPTSDHTRLYSYVLLLGVSASLIGILWIKKKQMI